MLPENWTCEAVDHYDYDEEGNALAVMCTTNATQAVGLVDSIFYVYLCDKHANTYAKDFWVR